MNERIRAWAALGQICWEVTRFQPETKVHHDQVSWKQLETSLTKGIGKETCV